jgi:hypothetical protein
MSKKLNLLLGSVFCVATGGTLATIATSCGPEANPYTELFAGKYYSIKNVKEANFMIQYVTANKCDFYGNPTFQYISNTSLNVAALNLDSTTVVPEQGKTILYWEIAYFLAVNIRDKKIPSVSFANTADGVLTCSVDTSNTTVTFYFSNAGSPVTGSFSYAVANNYALSHITLNTITGTQDTNTLY